MANSVHRLPHSALASAGVLQSALVSYCVGALWAWVMGGIVRMFQNCIHDTIDDFVISSSNSHRLRLDE